MEILKVENLTKIYGKGTTKVVALDNVSFSVRKGEFVAIVGASGSGKSTLLNVISSIDTYDEGEILYYGNETLPQRFFINSGKHRLSSWFRWWNTPDVLPSA